MGDSFACSCTKGFENYSRGVILRFGVSHGMCGESKIQEFRVLAHAIPKLDMSAGCGVGSGKTLPWVRADLGSHEWLEGSS